MISRKVVESLNLAIGPLFLMLVLSFFAPARADTSIVSSTEVKSLLDQGVTLVDIRRKDEWERSGVIQESKLLTFFDRSGNYDIDQWLQELAKVADLTKPIIIICATGYRSTLLNKLLLERSELPILHNASSGIFGWKHKYGTLAAYSSE